MNFFVHLFTLFKVNSMTSKFFRFLEQNKVTNTKNTV